MRLINTKTLLVCEFHGDSSIPPYVALAHCGTKDDVVFGETLDSKAASEKPGYLKLQGACRTARDLSIPWLWMDSICIDRSSSAELSEAINAMFQLYGNSEICIVYLHDLNGSPEESDLLEERLQRCEWMRRSWSLQELIAPKTVRFYDSQWTFIGTKGSLLATLSEITGINRSILSDEASLSQISVATRMSWASRCSPFRVEDAAYSLLGIFGVSMPIIYGEGRRAFLRLEEEILKDTDDASLFAWQATGHQQYRGILATSPAEFSHFANSPTTQLLRIHGDLVITSAGITIDGVFTNHDKEEDIILNLFSEESTGYWAANFGISLRSWQGRFVRSNPRLLLTLNDPSQGLSRKLCAQRDVDCTTSDMIHRHYSPKDREFPHKNKGARPVESMTPPPSFDASRFPFDGASVASKVVDGHRADTVALKTNKVTNSVLLRSGEKHEDRTAVSYGGHQLSLTVMVQHSSDPFVTCDGGDTESFSISTNKDRVHPLTSQSAAVKGALRDFRRPLQKVKEPEEEEGEDDMYLFVEPPAEKLQLTPGHHFTQVKDTLSDIAAQGLAKYCSASEDSSNRGKRTMGKTSSTNRKRPRIAYKPTNEPKQRWESQEESSVRVTGGKKQKEPRFACPFYAQHPLANQDCLRRYELRDIEDVKKHLWFSHRLPSFCPVCRDKFDTEAACRQHVMERSCHRRSEPEYSGITQFHMQKLAKRSRPGVSDRDKWFEIWDLVFPDEPRPDRVFLSGRIESLVCTAREYWACYGQTVISQFLMEKELQDYSEIQNEERELAALYVAILDQMVDQIVAGHWPLCADQNFEKSSQEM